MNRYSILRYARYDRLRADHSEPSKTTQLIRTERNERQKQIGVNEMETDRIYLLL